MDDEEYDGKSEEEELWKLAISTPTRFSQMTITDVRTGVTVVVDQSMDSTFGADKGKFKGFLQEFLNIYFGTRNKKYNKEFDGRSNVRINNLLIDFGAYDGERAWNWLIRYVKIVINLMDKEGVINLKQIEEDVKNGKYATGSELQQQV
jgi:hypothetical protein